MRRLRTPAAPGAAAPCSIENVYRGTRLGEGLLDLIPQIEIVPLGEAGQCAGAAGDYMLRRPDAAALTAPTAADRIPAGEPLILLTGNVGCAIHLADGLRARDQSIEVLHPVELLASSACGADRRLDYRADRPEVS